MRRLTAVVIGNAKTTRANVDALLKDVADSSDEFDVAFVYGETKSEAQVWADQLAGDLEWRVQEYHGDLTASYDTLISQNNVDDLRFFALWDDEDPDCQLAASIAQEHNIPMFDLVEGLMRIKLNAAPIQKPAVVEVPEAELVPIVEEPVETVEEPVEDEGEELSEEITNLIVEVAARLAEAIVDEVRSKLRG